MTIYASNALRPVVGNTYVPDSMEARGIIKPVPPVPGTRNGMFELVVAGLPAFEWVFEYMNQAELDWWKGIVGHTSGYFATYSKRFVTTSLPAARLWDQTGVITSYSIAVVDLPTWERYRNARYQNVTCKIHGLRAA